MRKFKVAILVYVEQTAVDESDAYNRVVNNMDLWSGKEFYNSYGPEEKPHHNAAEHSSKLSKREPVRLVMAKPNEEI